MINDIPNAYFVRKPISCEHILDRAGDLVKAATGLYAKAAGENIDAERAFYRILKYNNEDSTFKRVTNLRTGGAGQGKTTCEFAQGTLSGCNSGVAAYGGGGGSGVTWETDRNYNRVAGGAGGGGAGGLHSPIEETDFTLAGIDGATNTGGGGGGGGHAAALEYNTAGGKGGSGIIIIRCSFYVAACGFMQ